MKTELKIGAKYGKWNVLSFDRVDKQRRRRYNCRCECGQEKSVIASAIAAGKTKSCPRCKANDLTDRRFGLWTVIRRSDTSSEATQARTQWICRCECGDEHLVERCNLVKGSSKGCWICRRNVIRAEYFPRIWYRKHLSQAKQRGHEVSLSEKELWLIWESQDGKCPLTGLKIELTNVLKTTTASADRKDNEKGYVKGNVWFIHKHLNMMKHIYDLGYFVDMCHLVSEYHDNTRRLVKIRSLKDENNTIFNSHVDGHDIGG